MHFRSLAVCVTSAALLGSASASPSITRLTAPNSDPPGKRQVQEITNDLGCGAKGPLSGAWAIELFTCTADSTYTCQATESSGCAAGDPQGIESLMVTDSTTGTPLSVSATVAEASFQCPSNELVQCAVRFINNGTQAGNYGLRVINSTDTNSSSAGLSSDSSFGGPTDSSFGSPTDSSFGSPTDSSFGNPTDSSFGSPTDGGCGAPTSSSVGQPFNSSVAGPSGNSFVSSSTAGGFAGNPTGGALSSSGADNSPSGNSFASSTDTFASNPTGASTFGQK